MEFILRHIRRSGQFGWLYLANLFFALHYYVVHYINSSFLSTILPAEYVGVVFSIGSALALLALGMVSLVLQRLGNYRSVLWAIAFQFAIFIGLATQTDPGMLLALFGASMILSPVILFSLDIFLETLQRDEAHTGNTRGIFLTMSTGACFLSASLSGVLAGTSSRYALVYLVAALFLAPFFIIIASRFNEFVDPVYRTFSLRRTIKAVLAAGTVRHAYSTQFLMRFFFSWMVVYMPIYLHSQLGFSWPEIGLMFTIMLTPYLLIEYPAGVIADRWLGEKEMLIAGFVIVVLSTGLLTFLGSATFLVLAATLFVTRIGSALIEIMTESYFFKHTKGTDADAISFFRMQQPLAYILGPLSASFALLFVPLSWLWFILAGILTLGIYSATQLKDTR